MPVVMLRMQPIETSFRCRIYVNVKCLSTRCLLINMAPVIWVHLWWLKPSTASAMHAANLANLSWGVVLMVLTIITFSQPAFSCILLSRTANMQAVAALATWLNQLDDELHQCIVSRRMELHIVGFDKLSEQKWFLNLWSNLFVFFYCMLVP